MSSDTKRQRRAAHRFTGGWRCHYCDEFFPKHHRNRLTLDHIIPRSLDGPDRVWNRVLCCKPCNRDKGSQTYEEFTGRDFLPIQCWEHAKTTDEWLSNRRIKWEHQQSPSTSTPNN